MTTTAGKRIIHWYCKHWKLTSLRCDESVHLKFTHSIRATNLHTEFSWLVYFQLLHCSYSPKTILNWFLPVMVKITFWQVTWYQWQWAERHFSFMNFIYTDIIYIINFIYFLKDWMTFYSIDNPKANRDIKCHFHSSGVFLREE